MIQIDIGKTVISKVLFPFLVGVSTMLGQKIAKDMYDDMKKKKQETQPVQ